MTNLYGITYVFLVVALEIFGGNKAVVVSPPAFDLK